MNNKLSKFGEIVRVKRTLARQSLSDLAQAFNCSPSLLSAIETGQKQPSVDLAINAAAYLGMAIDEMRDLIFASIEDASSLRISPKNEIDKRLLASAALLIDRAGYDQKERMLDFFNQEVTSLEKEEEERIAA